MKYVDALTEADKQALQGLYSHGPTHRQRQRAQAVLLSAKGYTLEQIAEVLDAGRKTVSDWLDAWQAQGVDSLSDAPKSGRPRAIDAAVEAELINLLENPTPDLKAVVQQHLKKKASASAGTR